jgi:hypothetical protein
MVLQLFSKKSLNNQELKNVFLIPRQMLKNVKTYRKKEKNFVFLFYSEFSPFFITNFRCKNIFSPKICAQKVNKRCSKKKNKLKKKKKVRSFFRHFLTFGGGYKKKFSDPKIPCLWIIGRKTYISVSQAPFYLEK